MGWDQIAYHKGNRGGIFLCLSGSDLEELDTVDFRRPHDFYVMGQANVVPQGSIDRQETTFIQMQSFIILMVSFTSIPTYT